MKVNNCLIFLSLENFFQTNLFIWLIFDVIINLIHPFPLFDMTIPIKNWGFEYKIKFQTFMYNLTYIKVILLIRTFALYTPYSGVEAQYYW